MVQVSVIRRIPCRIGFRKALKGVRHKHLARSLTPGREDTPHENARATTPRARLNKIARNVLAQNSLNTRLEIFETAQSDHRVGIRTPQPAFGFLFKSAGWEL